jgi:hypothetical protein
MSCRVESGRWMVKEEGGRGKREEGRGERWTTV